MIGARSHADESRICVFCLLESIRTVVLSSATFDDFAWSSRGDKHEIVSRKKKRAS